MKRSLLTIILYLSAHGLILAQTDFKFFSGTFNNTSAVAVIEAIEEQTQTIFYYQSAWLDTMKISANFDSVKLVEVINTIFENSSISHYIDENEIILTFNVVIIDQLEIVSSFQNNDQFTKTEKGLVFIREYQNEEFDKEDIENYVFDIGNRNKMIIGGQSTMVGYVKNVEDGLPVTGTLVYIKDPFQGTTTDESGFYSITLPNKQHTLYFQYAGLKTTKRNVVLFSEGSLNVEMTVDVIALNEVVIEAEREANILDIKIGMSKINVLETKTVPLVLGESDILKIATTTAGVQTAGEGATGYNVRGGKADQNLYLINGVPIYNPNHFFGFFSAFNADAIRNMEIYKGSIPANYGGRLSSVFDIEEKTANKQKFSGTGGISPVTSRLSLEIPIKKDTTSIIIAGRTTYSDWLLKQVDNADVRETEVSFHDFIAKIDHTINEKNSVTLFGYISKDQFRLSSDTLFSFSNFSYANTAGSLKWKRNFNSQFNGLFSLIYSGYQYEVNYDESAPNAFRQDFDINEVSFSGDFTYYPSEKEQIQFGLSIKKYQINPGRKFPDGPESEVLEFVTQEEKGLESALYFSYQKEISKKLTTNFGIRYSMFNAMGPGTYYNYLPGFPKNIDNRLDSVNYSNNEIIKTFHGPEWRIFGRYSINEWSSFKLSINRTRQYIYMLSNSASLAPTDTCRVSGFHLKPQIADHISLGYFRNFLSDQLETSVEVYYKMQQNLVDFKAGGSFLLNSTIETEILQGDGKSYGIEFSIKKSGRLNGWINYTFARSLIKLDGTNQEERINDGNYYPTNYDKPHTINMVANYRFTKRISMSANLTYNTGRPVTVPVAVYDFRGVEQIHYADRNSFRIPDYFRIDIGFNLEGNHKIKKLAHAFWTFSIYNLLGRDNPYSVFFDIEGGTVKGHQLTVFGEPIPTITYNFKF